MRDVAEATPSPVQPAQTPHQLFKRFPEAFRPNPWIYWPDMLAMAALGWVLFAASVSLPFGTAAWAALTVAAIFVMYRAVIFIHELAHLKSGQLRHFELAWNVVAGVPMLVPSLMYVGSHMEHHKRSVFGTPEDPEYAALARWSRWRLAASLLTVAIVPVLLPIRWGVLGPLSRLVPPLRRLVVGRMSTLVINPAYTRPMPRGANARRWDAEEAAAALFVWGMAGAMAAGLVPLAVFAQYCIVAAGILVVNQLRTFVAHAYENDGAPMDAEGELLDSTNLRSTSPLTALLAPVGLRYHALHHAAPALPYHSLGWLHRRLLAELPRDAAYRATLRDGMGASLRALWERAAPPRPPDPPRFTQDPVARGL